MSFSIFPRKKGINTIFWYQRTICRASLTLKRLDVSPEKAIMVWNRIFTDILGGNKIGMKTVLVRLTGAHDSLY